MKRIWRDSDIDVSILAGKTLGLVGYGIQGRAQALNLRDSGVKVVVGGREGGKGIAAAKDDGFEAMPARDAAGRADVLFILTPDDTHEEILERDVKPASNAAATIGFATGFSVRFGNLAFPAEADVIMVAPKGPGRTLRQRFLAGSGLPALVGVRQNASGRALQTALAYAKAIGSGRVGVIESSFEEEAETDLFGEQAVLCGGIPRLMAAGFETLVSKGYSPEAAYIECIWEAKAIVDLVFEGGIGEMYSQVSPTARYGGLTRGRRVVGTAAEKAMRKVLDEVRTGRFAKELAAAPDARPELPVQLEETWQRLRKAFGV